MQEKECRPATQAEFEAGRARRGSETEHEIGKEARVIRELLDEKFWKICSLNLREGVSSEEEKKEIQEECERVEHDRTILWERVDQIETEWMLRPDILEVIDEIIRDGREDPYFPKGFK